MRKEDVTKSKRWIIADRLAEDVLPIVNAQCEEVVPSRSFYARYVKRVVDVAVSSVVLLITIPINMIIAVATLINLGRPLLFKQVRVGKDGKPFTLVKFRNMKIAYDAHGDLLPPEQRLTSFGRFMRSSSLDELLNFWSILKGDMSIIGPRPLVPEYTHRYSDRHKCRLLVRPGLECPPRAIGETVWTWNDQFENDVWYVEHVCFKVDCKMFFNLVRFAFDSKAAKARATADRGSFMGYDLSGTAINLDGVPQRYIDELDLFE